MAVAFALAKQTITGVLVGNNRTGLGIKFM
jgi:hypothetical protein